jgi:hypothetical protein
MMPADPGVCKQQHSCREAAGDTLAWALQTTAGMNWRRLTKRAVYTYRLLTDQSGHSPVSTEYQPTPKSGLIYRPLTG